MDVRMDLTGEDDVNRRLALIGARVADMSDPLGELGDRMLADVEQQFASEGGGRWKPLDDDYQRWKAKRFPGRGMMVLTGSLKRYLSSRQALTVGSRRLTYALPPRGRGLAKLEDRPVMPRVGRAEADLVFRDWLRDVVARSR